MTTSAPISSENADRVLGALRTALPDGPETSIDPEKASRRGEAIIVPVVPLQYPEDKWAFISGLAAAEIALRDEGLKVRLQSVVAQRMLVVAQPSGHGAVAYTTAEGREDGDLAKILGVDEGSLGDFSLEGYAYDTQGDLDEVLREARSEHPEADFSRVQAHRTTL